MRFCPSRFFTVELGFGGFMSAVIELDKERKEALTKIARRRKTSGQQLLEKAVDEFLLRIENEDLLETSAQTARKTNLRETDAAAIVRDWRKNQSLEQI